MRKISRAMFKVVLPLIPALVMASKYDSDAECAQKYLEAKKQILVDQKHSVFFCVKDAGDGFDSAQALVTGRLSPWDLGGVIQYDESNLIGTLSSIKPDTSGTATILTYKWSREGKILPASDILVTSIESASHLTTEKRSELLGGHGGWTLALKGSAFILNRETLAEIYRRPH